LDYNFFFIPQFTNVNSPSKTQPLCNWLVRKGLCSAFGNCKMKKWMRFVNAIAPWPIPVRQFLRNLQRCGVFPVKNEGWWAKKFNSKFAIDSKSFYPAFANPWRSLSGVRLTAQLANRCLIANYCPRLRDSAVTFKVSHRMGGGRIFLTNLLASLFNEDLSNEPNFSRIFLILPLKGQCHEIFCFWFFHQSVSPQPQSIPLGPFRIFSNICVDIRNSRLTTCVVDPGGKWKKSYIRKI
jgi:hypothetical protein